MNKQLDVSNVVLHTQRLTLRPFCQSDLTDFFNYAKVDGVGQMAGWLPHDNVTETQRILDAFIAEKKTFAIVFDGKVIGSLGIELYDEKACPEFDNLYGREIGYVLSKDYWGRGIMPEAVDAILQYLFVDQRLDFVLCGHFFENTQSMRVQQKCGFVRYKQIRYQTRWGEEKPTWLTLLTKQQYFERVNLL